MRKTVIFLFSFLFACESNCIKCHPKLKPLETNSSNPLYKEHHFLTTCTKCHPNHPVKGADKCGSDCFACHSREKLVKTDIPAHQKLKSCTKCHSPAPTDILPKSNSILLLTP
ncbi:hypothetical protein [Caminibacter sp.]